MRKRLTILVLSIVLPAALALGALVALNVAEARRAQEQALLATARAVSMAIDLELVRKIEALEALASSGAVAARDWQAVEVRAGRLNLGRDAWVSASDGAGARLLNSFDGQPEAAAPGDDLPRSPDLSRTVTNRQAAVSDLYRGPVSGRPVASIGAPAPGEGDVVVSIILDPVRFLRVIERHPLPPDAMVTIVDRQRRVVARSRDHDRYLGVSATPGMIRAMDAAAEGVVPSRSLEGVRTVVAYTPSDLSGWTAMVVAPRRTLEAPVWANLAGVGAIFLLVGAVSFVAVRSQSRVISGELDLLERDARAVGHGEIVARRPGHIASFNRVQAALSAASIELDRRDDRQKLLINELNHRVKNTLATVQALATQTFRGIEPEARRKFEQRLAALGGAHDLLTRTVWNEVEMSEVVARCGGDQDGRIQAAGPAVLLPPEAALALCMCVHELTTNSVKYGALSRPAGRVLVEWTAEEGDGIAFIWRETGGPEARAPAREGFGTRLMDRLVRNELNGRLEREYNSGGLVLRGYFRPFGGRRFRSDL